MTRLVMEEMGSVVFEHVDEALYALLEKTNYTKVFTIRREGAAAPARPTVPV